MLTNFAAIQRVRSVLSDTIQSADRAGTGNKARLLRGLLRQIDTAMENASEGHLAANKAFPQASRDTEAVQTGREASMRGRTEGTNARESGSIRGVHQYQHSLRGVDFNSSIVL